MASLVVISQSSLLLQQSLEARQYTMFFAVDRGPFTNSIGLDLRNKLQGSCSFL